MVILAVAMLASFFFLFFKKGRLVAMSKDRLFPMR
jgi:hypothetical protein